MGISFSPAVLIGAADATAQNLRANREKEEQEREGFRNTLLKFAQDESWPEQARSLAAQNYYRLMADDKLKPKDRKKLLDEVMAATTRPDFQAQQQLGQQQQTAADVSNAASTMGGFSSFLSLLPGMDPNVVQMFDRFNQMAPQAAAMSRTTSDQIPGFPTRSGMLGHDEQMSRMRDKAEAMYAPRAAAGASGAGGYRTVGPGSVLVGPDGVPVFSNPATSRAAASGQRDPMFGGEGWFVQQYLTAKAAETGRTIEDLTPQERVQFTNEANVMRARSTRKEDPLAGQRLDWNKNQDMFQRAQSIQKTFLPQLKDFNTISDAVARINAAADDQTGVSDVALIYSFIRLLDPGSVVRESEYGIVQSALPLVDRLLQAMWDKPMHGRVVTDDVKREVVRVSNQAYMSVLNRYRHKYLNAARYAEQWGVDPVTALGGLYLPQSLIEREPDLAQYAVQTPSGSYSRYNWMPMNLQGVTGAQVKQMATAAGRAEAEERNALTGGMAPAPAAPNPMVATPPPAPSTGTGTGTGTGAQRSADGKYEVGKRYQTDKGWVLVTGIGPNGRPIAEPVQ